MPWRSRKELVEDRQRWHSIGLSAGRAEGERSADKLRVKQVERAYRDGYEAATRQLTVRVRLGNWLAVVADRLRA